jgi:hypothetical protein
VLSLLTYHTFITSAVHTQLFTYFKRSSET